MIEFFDAALKIIGLAEGFTGAAATAVGLEVERSIGVRFENELALAVQFAYAVDI